MNIESSEFLEPLKILFPYQRAWVDDNARFKAGLWSRQTGKDFSTAAEAVRDAYVNPKTTWMIAAPSERQAIESLNKCKEWAEAFGYALEDADIEIERDAPNTLMKSGSITLPNGSRIIAVPGRPDTVRGFSANLVLTEFAFFDDPDATWKAVVPSISNPLRGGEKKIRLITTPNGKGGRGARTYKIFDKNYFNKNEGAKSPWSCHVVTINDAVRMGLPVDIDELREALDDPLAWAQEYMCEFLDSTNVLLPYDLIATAESFEASLSIGSDYWTSGEPYVCGIDFGRTNDPTVCWTLGKVGDTLVTREVLVLKDMPTDKQEEILSTRIRKAQTVCLDYTGPGIGLGDYLVKTHGEYNPTKHKFGKVELCTFTPDLKRKIFSRLRRAFEPPVKMRVPIDIEVREDLHAMQQIVTNGQYSYSAPHTAEGHSDRCTALALAVRAAGDAAIHCSPRRIAPKQEWNARGRRQRMKGARRIA